VTDTRYLTVADVIAVHERMMRRLGEAPRPLRDAGLLESAVMRPQAAAWYEGADLVRQAVLLATGISQAQAFLDGNKRTAYLALNTFLEMNGFSYTGDHIALAQQLEQVATPATDAATATDAFEAWLRDNVSPHGGGGGSR
jgi:death-on-curing protein